MLHVKRAGPGDLERVMEIYGIAQDFMIATGNPDQWRHSYPPAELIREDIEKGICMLICEGDAIHGVFALCPGKDPTYDRIYGGAWVNGEPYVTIHRIAGDGRAHGLLRCAVEHCRGLSDNIRIDTHEKNLIMQRQIKKNGFVKCGTILLENGDPRIAYQWTRA